jgi:hypothetical protein
LFNGRGAQRNGRERERKRASEKRGRERNVRKVLERKHRKSSRMWEGRGGEGEKS